MNDKCEKYEGLFIFGNDADLAEHIKTCPECQKKQEQMDKVSALIAEVAPTLRQKRKNGAKLKLACASVALLLFVSTLGVVNLNVDVKDTIMYGQTLTLEDYGLPVDSYGLISVN